MAAEYVARHPDKVPWLELATIYVEVDMADGSSHSEAVDIGADDVNEISVALINSGILEFRFSIREK